MKNLLYWTTLAAVTTVAPWALILMLGVVDEAAPDAADPKDK